jgi:hypothetical protein
MIKQVGVEAKVAVKVPEQAETLSECDMCDLHYMYCKGVPLKFELISREQ